MSFLDSTVSARLAVRDAALNAAKIVDRVVMGSQSQSELYSAADAATLGVVAAARNVGLAPNVSLKGNDVFFIGDSITAYGIGSSGGNNTGTTYAPLLCAQSWPAIAMGRSRGRLRYAGQAATGGFTSAQIKATHLPTAVAAKATFCVIMCGRNDVRTDVSAGTTIQNVKDMAVALAAVGTQPVLCSMAAQGGNTAGQEVTRDAINRGIRDYANSMGYAFVDFDRVTRTGDGTWISGYNLDVSHPSPVGADAMAKELLNTLLGRIPAILPIRPGVSTGNGNKVSNGKFANLTGWTVTGAPVVKDGVVSIPAGGKIQQDLTTVSGAKYAFNFAFRVDGAAPVVRCYVQEGASTLKAGIIEWKLSEGWMYMTFEYTASNTSSSIIIGSNAGTLNVTDVGLFLMV